MFEEKVLVIGLGYIGLPISLMLAKNGYQVIGYDNNVDVVCNINNRSVEIEQGLREMLDLDVVKRNLVVSTEVHEADYFIIAVPTPLDNKKHADLSFLVDVIKKILPFFKKGNTLIIESTIPPLTCKILVGKMIEDYGFKPGEDIFIAYCPERLRPGNILHDILNNSRIIGGINEESSIKSKKIYDSFVKSNIVTTDDLTAEVCKLVENSYRDVNIAFANEVDGICKTLGIDAFEVIKLANTHPNIDILMPGIGVGGHCLVKDPWFLFEIAHENCKLIRAAREVNEQKPNLIFSEIKKYISFVDNPKILLLGQAYKENSNDIRESPSVKIYDLLKNEGYNVTVYDPLTRLSDNIDILFHLVSNVDFIFFLVGHTILIHELSLIIDKFRVLGKTLPLIHDFTMKGYEIFNIDASVKN